MSGVAAAGARWMREMSPGVSSQPTMATQWNPQSNRILMVNPRFPLFLYPYSRRLKKISGFLFCSFSNSNCSTFLPSFPFSLTLPKAWFSVKYDMDGISENMIDFAACRFFHFLLGFTAFCELSYSQRRTIGRLKSQLKHFHSHCSNNMRTFL